MKPWALVTPASRGIGRALARRLLRTTQVPVVATARKDLSQATDQICDGMSSEQRDRLKVLRLDVLDEDSMSQAAAQCSQAFPSSANYLHLTFALPGILFPERAPRQIDHDKAMLTLRTNTLGPMLLMKHFSSLLPRKSTAVLQHDDSTAQGLPRQAVWATMSARVGSISDNELGGWYSYRASKSAVNQLTKTFDNHLKGSAGDKAMALALHPGTVKTGLSKEFWATVKEEKLFEPDFAADRLMDVILQSNTETHRGRCWDWKGKEIPP